MVPGEGWKVKGFSALMRHSMAWPEIDDVGLIHLERAAGGDADLFAHDVEAGDGFGDGMLDLQARVHLDEIEPAVLEQEFDRAGAEIADLLERACVTMPPISSRCAALSAGLGASSQTFWWRRCSEQSRSPRCSTLPWPSARICTSMWRGLLQIFFEIDRIVAEGGFGLGARRRERHGELRLAIRDLHAASAAARRRLDENGIADVARNACGLRVGAHAAVRTGHGRNAGGP